MSDLFIPKKIKVGFQNRAGTYTGKLAYVIYFDNKGILRKEKSWQSWRDNKIEPEEYDNNPQDGFCLNKDVKRFNWSHFGSNRSYIRMYDPRGIEFEVTPENLIGILTETDCLKRGLEGKFVYAWKGTELVLLPCGSEEYQKATIYTERQSQDISAKDLKPGCSYTAKKGEEVIYIGRFPWYEWNRYDKKIRKATKQHIFAHPIKPQWRGRFFKKGDVKFLASLNSADAVINYADLVDEWNKDVRSAAIEKWEFLPEDPPSEDIFDIVTDKNGYSSLKKDSNRFIRQEGSAIFFWYFSLVNTYLRDQSAHFEINEEGLLDTAKMEYAYTRSSYLATGYRGAATKQQILDYIGKSVKVKMMMSNGKKISVRTIDDVAKD